MSLIQKTITQFLLLCTLIINIFPVNDPLNQSQHRQVLLENIQNVWFMLCMTGNEKYPLGQFIMAYFYSGM